MPIAKITKIFAYQTKAYQINMYECLLFILAYQQDIFAHQDFCLSSIMPIVIFISLMYLQNTN